MATLNEIQKRLDDKTLDPRSLSADDRRAIDELIKRGALKGPSMAELGDMRDDAGRDVSLIEETAKNPIGVKLEQEDSMFKGRSEAILAGDLIGSITPYVMDRKKIFSAAKSKIAGDKNTGLFPRKGNYFKTVGDNMARVLPGRFKLLGGTMRALGGLLDKSPIVGRLGQSQLVRTEVKSVLGGTAGAAAGSVGYDALNETAGVAIMDAIASDMQNMSPKEVDTDMMANAADAAFTAFAWNAGAATLTPFVTKGLGKVARLTIGAKSKDAKELVNIARDKGLPLPMVMTAQEGVGLFGGFANKFFKVLGIMPFINGIGKEALQGAEQKAGKEYLNTSVLNYGPLVKTGILSASIYKQAEQAFIQNSNLINASYKGFETLADTIGNPKVIPTAFIKKAAAEQVDAMAMNFPGLKSYAQDKLGTVDPKEIQKLLGQGDPLAQFYRYMNQVDDFITPREYKGVTEAMNRALSTTQYQNIRANVWSLREALENDLNSFGANISKETFLKDDTVKAAYETLSKTNKAAADADMALKIKSSEQLKDQLYNANDVFSTLMNFYQNKGVPNLIKQFNKNTFTNKALAGIRGIEKGTSQEFFERLTNNVFKFGDPKAIDQFQQLLGAKGIVSEKTGKSIGVPFKGGQALYQATKARFMWNQFIDAFESTRGAEGQALLARIADDANVATGINGTVDVMQSMSNVAKQSGEEILDFNIEKVKLGNGIFDAQKLKFSPKDTSGFQIDRFIRNLGLGTGDMRREAFTKMMGGLDKTLEFDKFITYMKAVSNTPIADTSTFMQRRLQLGGLNSFTGALVLGGSAAVNPLAPALFILLGRRAGQILTDPIAMRAFNDALNPDEQIKLLMGQKVGEGVPGVLGVGRRFFKGRDIQTAANVLQKPGVIGRLGLTQKREAFARLMNYLRDNEFGAQDIPDIDFKNATPEEITERMQQISALVPQPIYDEKTLPKKNFDVMFAQDFSGTSGNLQEDNNAVDFLRAATTTEAAINEEEAPIENIEKTMVTDDIQLEDPVQAGQAPMQPDTGQVDPQKFAALFPEDNSGQAIANRGVRRG